MLSALLVWIGWAAPWSADVGAHLYQARAMAEGRGPAFGHPFVAADPGDTLYPFHLSFHGADGGYVVYPKHVALTWVIGGLYRIGGLAAVLALSTASTVAAAIGTARLAQRLNPAAAVPALWLAGAASPLLFDGFTGYAHTLAAAGIAWSTMLVLPVRSERGDADPSRVAPIAGLAILALAIQTRTEAPLAGFALALALAVTPGFGRRGRTTAAAVAATTIGATVVDRLLAVATSGHVVVDPRVALWGLVDGRLAALANTWLRSGSYPVDVAVLGGSAALVSLIILRRRPVEVFHLVVAAVALAAYAWRLTLTPPPLVPGLMVAAPLPVVGLGWLRLGPMGRVDRDRLVLVVAFAAFCLAVLATEYPYGGVAEWGGRYFAAGLPLGLAPAAVGLVEWYDRHGRTQGPRQSQGRRRSQGPHQRRARLLLAIIMVATATLNLGGLAALRSSRLLAADLGHSIEQAANRVGTDDNDNVGTDDNDNVATAGRDPEPGPGPVVVSLVPAAPRLVWDRVDDGRWLLATPDDLPTLAPRLVELGVDRLVIITLDPADRALLDPWYRVEPGSEDNVGATTIAAMAVATPSSEVPASDP